MNTYAARSNAALMLSVALLVTLTSLSSVIAIMVH